jgi:NTE family protein
LNTGLALEGGGARGAYHLGAVKALYELGYKPDVIAGTSIGALNGAFLVQGDFDKAYSMWEDVSPSLLFDVDDGMMEKLRDKDVDREAFAYFAGKVREIIKNKGLSTERIRQLLEENIDEDRVRRSKIELGIVTISLSDRKPLELFMEDIPKGQLHEYLMASAYLPAFRMERLNGKYYLDGGFYDKCPVDMLVRKGCRKIFAIHVTPKESSESYDADVVHINPSANLGGILAFESTRTRVNLKMGYYDTMRTMKGYLGRLYCIKPPKAGACLDALLTLPGERIESTGELFGLSGMEPRRMLLEKIIPSLAGILKLEAAATYEEILVGVVEHMAMEAGIDRFDVYPMSELLAMVQNKAHKITEKSGLSSVISDIAQKANLAPLLTKDTTLKRAFTGLFSDLEAERFTA